MASLRVDGSTIFIETDLLSAEIHTEGYVSGVAAGTLLDKTTGARDLGFGLDIVDFLLEPLPDVPGEVGRPYVTGDMYHGDIIKRYVELPQICTGARKLPFETFSGQGWVAVKQWFSYTEATYGRRPGSRWEQTIVFQDGLRHSWSADRVTSANSVDDLFLRIDMPGHLKHVVGDSFEQIYLSYEGFIPSSQFTEDFRPDDRFLYRRGEIPMPAHMIRAYQVRTDGRPGPWLGGITLDPAVVSEAWCHQRGYVCFIQEIGLLPVAEGESFGAAYAVGWFDSVEQMQQVGAEHAGAQAITLEGGFSLV